MKELFNPINIVFISIGILSIVVTVYFAIKSLIRIEPKLYYENNREVSKLSKKNRNITVRYADRVVDRVTTTRIWFWNNGKKPLKREDVPPAEPLSIKIIKEDVDAEKNSSGTGNIEILDFNLVKASIKSCNFNIKRTQKPDTLELNFDFIDYRHGVIFDIQHNCNDKCKIDLEGVILGPQKNRKILTNSDYNWITQRAVARIVKHETFIKKTFKYRLTLFYAMMLVYVLILFIGLLLQPPTINSSIDNFEKTAPSILTNIGIDSVKSNIATYALKQGLIRDSFSKLTILPISVTLILIILMYFSYKKVKPYPSSLFIE